MENVTTFDICTYLFSYHFYFISKIRTHNDYITFNSPVQ